MKRESRWMLDEMKGNGCWSRESFLCRLDRKFSCFRSGLGFRSGERARNENLWRRNELDSDMSGEKWTCSSSRRISGPKRTFRVVVVDVLEGFSGDLMMRIDFLALVAVVEAVAIAAALSQRLQLLNDWHRGWWLEISRDHTVCCNEFSSSPLSTSRTGRQSLSRRLARVFPSDQMDVAHLGSLTYSHLGHY